MTHPRHRSAGLRTALCALMGSLALAAVALSSSGCATAAEAAHIRAAEAQERNWLGAWDVHACSTLAGIPVIPRDGLRYVLVRSEGGPALLVEAPGTPGALLTDRWVDEDGMHFFASDGEEASELVLRGPNERGIRRVYRSTSDDARPSGPVTAVCPMVVSAL